MGALVVVPLAVLGWDTVADIVGERLPARVHTLVGVALAVVLVSVTASSQGLAVLHHEVRKRFFADADSLVLTPDERAIIERLPVTTEPDAVLVVNPYQGGSLAYALADRRVTHYYMNTTPSDAGRYLAEHLRDAATDPAVCAAVQQTGAHHALVLEPFELAGTSEREPTYPGMVGLATAPGFERIDAQGVTALYRITACD